ncbi:hypothetical protein L6452_20621 [Arctium lappa]|uniref:Uncharacterized protein n=1 Tax=Arctium lappa TaxID=4217 RepID=A0ACB9BBG1_ARCLA|nr:hypothetical protein L6452_20621 [Arctium lappa]
MAACDGDGGATGGPDGGAAGGGRDGGATDSGRECGAGGGVVVQIPFGDVKSMVVFFGMVAAFFLDVKSMG